ncbi:MAG: hypothetical protein WC959_02295 [Kiritimatiellales bacterium]
MSTKRAIGVAIAGMIFAGASHAMLITDVTTNKVLFDSGGFEGGTVGSAPDGAITGTLTGNASTLIYGPDSAGPGAYSGDNYAMSIRNGGSGLITMKFDQAVTATGTVLKYEWVWYVTAGSYARLIGLDGAGSNGNNDVVFDVRLRNSAVYDLNVKQSDNFYVDDQWIVCSLEYTLGATSVVFTAGTQSIDIATRGNSETGTMGVAFAQAANGTYYVDSIIPEPAVSFYLLVGSISAIGLKRRR